MNIHKEGIQDHIIRCYHHGGVCYPYMVNFVHVLIIPVVILFSLIFAWFLWFSGTLSGWFLCRVTTSCISAMWWQSGGDRKITWSDIFLKAIASRSPYSCLRWMYMSTGFPIPAKSCSINTSRKVSHRNMASKVLYKKMNDIIVSSIREITRSVSFKSPNYGKTNHQLSKGWRRSKTRRGTGVYSVWVQSRPLFAARCKDRGKIRWWCSQGILPESQHLTFRCPLSISLHLFWSRSYALGFWNQFQGCFWTNVWRMRPGTNPGVSQVLFSSNIHGAQPTPLGSVRPGADQSIWSEMEKNVRNQKTLNLMISNWLKH